MPLDEIAGAIAAEVAGKVVGTFAEASVQLIFNKYVARYFHGVGRHVLMAITFGKLRIPSSLREVPKGVKPKPTGLDWLALFVGVVTWGTAVAVVVTSLAEGL